MRPGFALLDIDDLSASQVSEILNLSRAEFKAPVLQGLSVASYFEHPSNRTRNSVEVAVSQLGGFPISLMNFEVGMDERESAEDVAMTLSCYHWAVFARVRSHDTLKRIKSALATTEVHLVNSLSDLAHPLQALADLLTIRESFDANRRPRVSYVGDSNNVARSLAKGCMLMDLDIAIASPAGFDFSQSERSALAEGGGGTIAFTDDPLQATEGTDVIYTDVFTSMGQEGERERRLEALRPYAITPDLVKGAAPDAIVMHCLPAHRGEEISAEVLQGPQSAVWRQAENRLHATRGYLLWLKSIQRGSMLSDRRD